MFARVFDLEREYENQFYKSMIYALVTTEGEPLPPGFPGISYHDQTYAVVFDDDEGCFKFILKKNYAFPESIKYIETVHIFDSQNTGWDKLDLKAIDKLNSSRQKDCKLRNIISVHGYPDVINDLEFLSEMINRKRVPKDEYKIELRLPEDKNKWNYISTQKEADELLIHYNNFHEFVIDKIIYEEDAHSSHTAIITLTYYGINKFCKVQLCFEGVHAMNIRTGIDYGYLRDIPFLRIKATDEYVICGNDCIDILEDIKNKDDEDSVTFVRAICLKWREVKEQ